jgi:bifunctional aspartokinase / homoserine dehydrogenase 1
MSDKIIRLGGSQVYHTASIKNLVTYIKDEKRITLIINSAVPEIHQIVSAAINNAKETDAVLLGKKLLSFYTSNATAKLSPEYIELVEQLSGIIKGIALTDDYSNALKDQVLSYSERLTSEIFKAQFYAIGAEAQIISPEQIGLRVTSDYGNATYLSVDKLKLQTFGQGIYIIPGSYGATENGKTARAGKSAADYTAAFITNELGFEKLELWGIDQAFHRADTSIIYNTPKILRLTYSEASELAYFDHYSFHPRTVEPLEFGHIPIHIIDTETCKTNTIINTETYIENQIVKSVACTEDISLLRLDGPGVGLKPGILARVTSRLNQAGINIKSVITSQISINLILEKKTGGIALEYINQLGFSSVKEISLDDDVSMIGIVGHGMQQNYGVSAKIFGAVANHHINVLLSGSGASDLVSYLVVKASDKNKSVRAIYDAFFNSDN